MSQELVIGIYGTIAISMVVIYLYIMLSLRKSEHFSYKKALGFTRNHEEHMPTNNRESIMPSISVDQQIEQLYEQLNSLEGEERITVWNQIQELKKQKVAE